MTFKQIRDVILTRVQQITGLRPEDIDYPNSPKGPFDPTGRDLWAAVNDLPGTTSVAEIGDRPCYSRGGVMMIILYVPSNTGTVKITEAADAVAEAFEGYSANGVDFGAASLTSRDNSDAGWYQTSVSVPYSTSGA